MFRKGDIVKLKKGITSTLLKKIGIDSDFKKGKVTSLANGYYSEQFNKNGQDVRIQGFQREWRMPTDWVELDKPRGHHLTTIFK